MTATSLPAPTALAADRAGRDRLELLTALLQEPSIDPVFTTPVIEIPADHPAYHWGCTVCGCQRSRTGNGNLCTVHLRQWGQARQRGLSRDQFVAAAEPLARIWSRRDARCAICLERPATRPSERGLCHHHANVWKAAQHRAGEPPEFAAWVAGQQPLPGYGECRVTRCPDLADSPLGLCSCHRRRYEVGGRPGGAALPTGWWQTYESRGDPVPVSYDDKAAFTTWCARAAIVARSGRIILLGLRPLLMTEFQWALATHAAAARPARWSPERLQRLATHFYEQDVGSISEVGPADLHRFDRSIAARMQHYLRQACFSPPETRQAGFLETEHFGVRFPARGSHIDLTAIPQEWLRTLLWDYFADLLRSPKCPRTASQFDGARRAITELGGFLAVDATRGGHDPTVLTAEHMHRFVADQRHRARTGAPSLAITVADGQPSTVSDHTFRVVCSGVRTVLRDAMDSGRAETLGLAREFIVAMHAPGRSPITARRPFPDDVARALADGTNLACLAATYDPQDRGLRDVWEAIVLTGRRVNEVLRLRWDCLGRYGGLAMLWHDQTKVGRYDAAIRIPEHLYEILAARQRKTLDRFASDHQGRTPEGSERAQLALFPTPFRNRDGITALNYQWFSTRFRQWVTDLDLGPVVAHQARHTLATRLLRAGASLAHIRAYLGQFSDRMAEHYVHLAHSDLEDVLQHVWVAGPGAATPGELLTSDNAPLSCEQAQALAIDLSRRSTPTEGGFCTFQPVVDGGACPWNLDCGHCDKFVLSGADLLYWRRKREQWRQLAEGAPDDATAEYLHRCFEPTAAAIEGLESALAGLDLLDEALAMDLRKPQDYFQRVWSTAFRAADLATPANEPDSEAPGEEPEEGCA